MPQGTRKLKGKAASKKGKVAKVSKTAIKKAPKKKVAQKNKLTKAVSKALGAKVEETMRSRAGVSGDSLVTSSNKKGAKPKAAGKKKK